MWHSLERLIKVQKFQLYSIYYRSVLRKMSVGLLVWWVFIEESVSMVGMVSLDALLLVCHGSDLWGASRGGAQSSVGLGELVEGEKAGHAFWRKRSQSIGFGFGFGFGFQKYILYKGQLTLFMGIIHIYLLTAKSKVTLLLPFIMGKGKIITISFKYPNT